MEFPDMFFMFLLLFTFGIPLNETISNGTLFIVIAYAIKNGLTWKYFWLNQSKPNEKHSIKANKLNRNELHSTRIRAYYLWHIAILWKFVFCFVRYRYFICLFKRMLTNRKVEMNCMKCSTVIFSNLKWHENGPVLWFVCSFSFPLDIYTQKISTKVY